MIEEQEGIEADILRRLARHGRSLGQIPTAGHPALLVVSPRAAARGGGRPERCRMALLPGDAPLPGWDLQAASAASPCPAGRGGSCGWPSSGSWSPSRARWWTGRSSLGCWTTAPPPSPPWRWPAPSSCWASRRNSSPSPISRHSRKWYPPIDKPSFLIYNHGTPPRGGVILSVCSGLKLCSKLRQAARRAAPAGWSDFLTADTKALPLFRRGLTLAGLSREFCYSGAHPHPPQCEHWGTFPLEVGRLGGRTMCAPTVGDRPVSLVRQSQAREWNRNSRNFCKLRAQWPGRDLERHSDFARRNYCRT